MIENSRICINVSTIPNIGEFCTSNFFSFQDERYVFSCNGLSGYGKITILSLPWQPAQGQNIWLAS